MLMSLSISVMFVRGSERQEPDDDNRAERQAEAEDQVARAAGAHLRPPVSSCAAREVLFLEADVVVDRRRGQLGAGLVALVGHHQIEHRPDAVDALELACVEVLHALVAPVEDVRGGDDERSLEDEADRARELGVRILRPRLEQPRRMARAVGRRPGGVVGGEGVGVVGDVAAADVFVAQVAADEALLLFLAGDAAHAAERRQVQEALVVGARVLPDEKGGVADVVRIGKADQGAVAFALLPAEAEHRQGALADAALAVDRAASASRRASRGRCCGRGPDVQPIRRCSAVPQSRLTPPRTARRRRGDEPQSDCVNLSQSSQVHAGVIGDTPAKRPHPACGCTCAWRVPQS